MGHWADRLCSHSLVWRQCHSGSEILDCLRDRSGVASLRGSIGGRSSGLGYPLPDRNFLKSCWFSIGHPSASLYLPFRGVLLLGFRAGSPGQASLVDSLALHFPGMVEPPRRLSCRHRAFSALCTRTSAPWSTIPISAFPACRHGGRDIHQSIRTCLSPVHHAGAGDDSPPHSRV